ncbi:MAG: hypothetical protein RHS_4115 [Robinsoniella sp. RHS]|nr:MAG: hypothetical protein RHS_4115 [Robinsoniella sp. RHS]
MYFGVLISAFSAALLSAFVSDSAAFVSFSVCAVVSVACPVTEGTAVIVGTANAIANITALIFFNFIIFFSSFCLIIYLHE